MSKIGHVVILLYRNVEGLVLLLRNAAGSFVVVLLLRNVEVWSCSTFVVKKY